MKGRKERIRKALIKFFKYFAVLVLAYAAGMALHWTVGAPKPDIGLIYTWATLVFIVEITGWKIF